MKFKLVEDIIIDDSEPITYAQFIQNIIETRGQWSKEVLNSKRGCESHHIIPACLGGEGDGIDNLGRSYFKRNSQHENCIYLYPAEHFVAHKLLAVENPTNKQLISAFSMMAFPKGKTKREDMLTKEEYEEARKLWSKLVSGAGNPMYGKAPWNKGLTKETDSRVAQYAKKLSISKKGVKKGPDSEETKALKSAAQHKRYEEHPETFIGPNKDKLCITDDKGDAHYIDKDEPLPDGYRYGQGKRDHYNLDNYYSNPEMQARRSQSQSGENNGMYGKGYKLSGGNNGHATIRFFYKDKSFESRLELLTYLQDSGLNITDSALRTFIRNEGTDRLYKMYGDILKDISWEYKDENKKR